MAVLSLQNAGAAGAAPSLVAASGGGDSFPLVSSRQTVHIKNASGGAIDVTFVVQHACNFGVLHTSPVVNVPAGQERFVTDLDPRQFADANGRLQLTYSGVTNLTVGSHA